MSLSSQQLSQYLPRVRELIRQWESTKKQANNPAERENSTVRDVVVVFRTRPILPGEADMLAALVHVEDGEVPDPDYFLCSGISVKQEQNIGTMIAHVPSLKVCEFHSYFN